MPCSPLPNKPSPSGCVMPNATIGAPTIASTTADNHANTPKVNNIYGTKGI